MFTCDFDVFAFSSLLFCALAWAALRNQVIRPYWTCRGVEAGNSTLETLRHVCREDAERLETRARTRSQGPAGARFGVTKSRVSWALLPMVGSALREALFSVFPLYFDQPASCFDFCRVLTFGGRVGRYSRYKPYRYVLPQTGYHFPKHFEWKRFCHLGLK